MDANLRSRLTTALVAIPFLIAVIGWGHPWLFAAVILLLTLGALGEYFSMAFPGRVREQFLGMIFGLAMSLWLLTPKTQSVDLGLSVGFVLVCSIYLFMAGALEERLVRLAWTLLGILYIGYLTPHWVLLFRLPDGRAWVFFVLFVIMAGDVAAYFAGRLFGSKRIAPEISPGKTLEGALGNLAASVIAGSVGAKFLSTEVPLVEALVLSGSLSVLGQIGDLFESLIKRVFTVKDSGTLLPGHGGLLDRLDSLLFPAAFTAAYLKFFRL